MHTKRQRAFLLMTCATLMVALFFSILFITLETEHHCIGDDCPICASLQQAEQTLNLLGAAHGPSAWPTACSVQLAESIILSWLILLCISPVAQKVRMNN